MKIHQLLERDPRQTALANGGQARIVASPDRRATDELRAELETFVCDGQYGDALDRILQSYLTQLDRPRQNAAWVSGFFGSGKSHLLKMLEHLWVDTTFEDGATARSLVRGLPEDVDAALRELNTRANRTGARPVAAAGTLPSGSGEHVRLTVLSVVLRACGWPEKHPQAEFCFWLRERGFLDAVRGAVESAGKNWFSELNDLYVSGVIANAVLEQDPNFAHDEREARKVLRERFPNPRTDITTEEFLEACRKALSTDGELPLTVIVLDEVQQYIGDSSDRAVAITELAEAIQTQLDSRVMLVASGQSALAGTPHLQKLKDRFAIAVQLSDTDVEAVTRKVLLHKRPSAVEPIKAMLEQNAGEISRQLQGTRIAERVTDRETLVPDYPLLPIRRRFWEECFRAVDAAGTHSQLRSQLRILHDALQGIAEHDLGVAIPADALYEAIAPDLVNTGVLLNELSTRIQELDDGTEQGRLRKRICAVVFLISKLPSQHGDDTGVRATARTVSDLLVDDLKAESGFFRREVESQLEAMVEDGTLMKVGEEYRLQTTQGAEWDRAFREQHGALRQRTTELQAKQDQLLAAAVQSVVTEVRPKHGESKVPRTLALHARPEEPEKTADGLVVWMRDGASSNRKAVETEARRRGQDDPVIHVFLRRPGDDLRTRIIEAEAARRVLDAKGMPSEPAEAREACESMRSRAEAAEAARDELIRDLVASARVFLGGGSEVFGDSLQAKLTNATNKALARLYPRFGEGDHRQWPVALRRAREGNDQPLQAVDWKGATEEHPTVRQVLSEIGSGAKGSEVRKALKAPPFGWPQDAIDAALIALHRSGAVRVRMNGQPVPPAQLDQNRISVAEFRPEKVRLSATDKIALRSLYQRADIQVKTGEEEVQADSFLGALLDMASKAGGDPPLPPMPDTTLIEDLRRLGGTEQLGKILAHKEELESNIETWRRLRDRARERTESWNRLQQMLELAGSLPEAEQIRPEVDAIVRDRSLLSDTDYVVPLRKRLEGALRSALRDAHARCQRTFEDSLAQLEASEEWKKLSPEDRQRILREQRLQPLPPLDVDDEDRLLRALQQRPLERWSELADGLPTRFAQARETALKALEPKVRSVPVKSDILRTEADLDSWLSAIREQLARRLAEGPIVIG